jgi:nitrate reductase NapE component
MPPINRDFCMKGRQRRPEQKIHKRNRLLELRPYIKAGILSAWGAQPAAQNRAPGRYGFTVWVYQEPEIVVGKPGRTGFSIFRLIRLYGVFFNNTAYFTA